MLYPLTGRRGPYQKDQDHGPNRAHSLVIPEKSTPILDKNKQPTADHKFEDDALAALKEVFQPA